MHFEYFGERAAGPFRGTTGSGWDSFSVKCKADIVQRSAQVQVFFHYAGINLALIWYDLNLLFLAVPSIPERRFPTENPPISPASKPVFFHAGRNHFQLKLGYGGKDGEHELTTGTGKFSQLSHNHISVPCSTQENHLGPEKLSAASRTPMGSSPKGHRGFANRSTRAGSRT